MPKLPLTGGAYELSSLDASRQRAVNLFYSTTAQDQGTGVLLPTPGMSELVDVGNGGPIRALIKFVGDIYVVSGNTLYKLTDVDLGGVSATATSVGTLNTSSGFVSWDINPTQIMMVDGIYGYIYTPSTNTFAEITDDDFTGGVTVTFFDSFFFYNTPDSSTMFATAINDGTSVNSLDVATAEGRPDKLVAVIADKRELWAFGEDTIEIWINVGNEVGFPLSRRDGAFLDRGCSAAHSIIKIENTLMWLDDRGFIVMADGYRYKIVSTEAINQEVSEYTTISDAFAWQNIDRGHVFYMITFPTEGKTWGYDLTTGRWHERAYRASGQALTHHLSSSRIRVGQSEIVGSRLTGQVFIMSSKFFDDAGDEIHRIRVSSHVDVERNLVSIPEFEVPMETGKATSTGNGSNPQLMLRYSNDGGYTYSNEITRDIGKIGEYKKSIRFNRLGVGRDWIFETRIASPIKFSIMDPIVTMETF